MTRVKMIDGYQCPGCGVPVDVVTLQVHRTPDDAGYGLLLEDCGHLVTLEMIRDAWGLDFPDPNPARVNYGDEARG